MQNEEKIATIAFLNARENPGKYARGVYDLVVDAVLAAAEDDPDPVATDEGENGGAHETGGSNGHAPVDYDEYVGQYLRGLGASETAVVHWKGGIAMLGLPTDDPRGRLRRLQHVDGDVFRQVGSDGELEGKVIFDRNAQGRIILMRNPTNYARRVH